MTERSNKKKYPLCAAALALAVLLAGCAPAEGTAVATAQPTAEPTEAPTPTPEPEANPLTGEQGDYTNQRPVAVSIRTGDGSTPQWGIAAADVLIEGVTEGKTAGLTAVFASVDSVEKAGPVAPGRDLPLQLVLPLNTVPVHINKSVYASNLLNVLQYQDLDGYHAGTAGFAFDEDRANSGYREENCWYTTKDLINTGLATYNTDTAGANMPLFHFVQRKDPEQQNAKSMYITFSNKDTEELVYSPEVGLYLKNNADGSPMMDAGNNEQAAFTNVFVLYASSGVKDDGVTRQYDLTGGTGIYLTKGGWETIQWTKGDATAPLQLTDASGKTLDVNPGKSFLAIWGGYYGQALRLLDGDGNEQALPEKPALLDSAVPDEAAEAAELEQQRAQALADAQDKLNQAQTALNEALQAQQDAAGTADSADDDAASQRVAEAQAAYDEKQAAKLEEKLRKNSFTLQDYYDQLQQLRGMGDLSQLADMMPGNVGRQLQGASIDPKVMAHTEAIILSMTPQERENPQILGASRKKRIAKGCGLEVVDVNRLLKQFEAMRQMLKQFNRGRLPGMRGGFRRKRR